jgi:hypothetical protein
VDPPRFDEDLPDVMEALALNGCSFTRSSPDRPVTEDRMFWPRQ